MTSIGHFDNLCREGDKTWHIFVTKIMESPFTPSLYLHFSCILSFSISLPPSFSLSLSLPHHYFSLYLSIPLPSSLFLSLFFPLSPQTISISISLPISSRPISLYLSPPTLSLSTFLYLSLSHPSNTSHIASY